MFLGLDTCWDCPCPRGIASACTEEDLDDHAGIKLSEDLLRTLRNQLCLDIDAQCPTSVFLNLGGPGGCQDVFRRLNRLRRDLHLDSLGNTVLDVPCVVAVGQRSACLGRNVFSQKVLVENLRDTAGRHRHRLDTGNFPSEQRGKHLPDDRKSVLLGHRDVRSLCCLDDTHMYRLLVLEHHGHCFVLTLKQWSHVLCHLLRAFEQPRPLVHERLTV